MGSAELEQVERRALRAYERAALRRAAIGAIPMVVAAAAAIFLARDPRHTGLLAAFVVGVAVVALWVRRGAETAAALGFFAGLVPYLASLLASRFGGHVCTPGGCVAMCLPACTAGGVVAAVLVARSAAKRRAGPLFWLTASGMTIATGALGCSCAGFAGASGMLAGFAITVVPAAIAARWGASRS
jgi:hypothetical protein